ncbi:MAG TPA: rhomboid family intramembrane serine protease [Verrucomicrobiae bacterium]|jgi:membrane associated rhomboid family serine protease/Flp pilus assembly protein TadD|nr:rhomboid family intramembrane serine protease [Verrucomicrobiae bacterium]
MRRPPSLATLPRYPIVAGTALLAIGVTVASWLNVDVSPLMENAMIRHGELWRLVTSIFPHLSPLHLLFNVYWLWVFGTLVEEVFGHVRTAALILLFAVGSGSLEYAFSVGGAGLSGVGYGFFGLLWILSRGDERFRDAIDTRTIQLFIGWFFLCILLTLTNVLPVGNIAHGSGAVLGILAGYAITLRESRMQMTAAIVLILVFGLWAATLGRPMVNMSSQAGYDEARLGYDALLAGHNDEAVRWFREALVYRRKPPEFNYFLGVACERQKNMPAALDAYRKAADLGHPGAQNRLGFMYDKGEGGLPVDETQAVEWYRKAADQGDPSGENNLAWAYATSANPAIRNPAAALRYAAKAVSATKDKPVPAFLDTLAEAYYVNQKYAEAEKTEQQALALNPTDSKSDYEERLRKYQQALGTKPETPKKETPRKKEEKK